MTRKDEIEFEAEVILNSIRRIFMNHKVDEYHIEWCMLKNTEDEAWFNESFISKSKK